MEQLEQLVASIADFVWGPPLLILLLGTHLWLTIRSGVIQRYLGTAIRISFRRDTEGTGDISQFGALTTAFTFGRLSHIPANVKLCGSPG